MRGNCGKIREQLCRQWPIRRKPILGVGSGQGLVFLVVVQNAFCGAVKVIILDGF